MNKWTIKKAFFDDELEIHVPNTTIGLLIIGRKNKDSRYAEIRLSGYLNDKGKNYYNDKITNEELQDFKKQIMEQLKPLIEEIGNKFDKLVRAKGFITQEDIHNNYLKEKEEMI